MVDRIAPMGVSLGRQAQLRSMQSNLAVLTAEMSSGRKADPTRQLGVGASMLYKLYDDVQQGGALQNSTSLAGQRLTAMQEAMSSVGDLMDQMSPEILKVDSLRGNGYDIIASNAREMLASMTDLLNTNWDGQNLFAGTDSAAPPLADSTRLLDWSAKQRSDAVAAAGGVPLDAAGAGDLIDAVSAMFDSAVRDSRGNNPADPADAFLDSNSFYGLVYQSTSRTVISGPVVDENGAAVTGETDQASLIRIGAGETLNYNVRADNPAFKDAFKALSLLSMLDRPGTEMSAEAKTALLDEAGTLMRGARSQLTVVAGVLGGKQERLDNVAAIQDRAVTAATAQINDLEGADYYTISDQISTLQIQLQATYSITAQLSKLSLVNYL